MKSTLYTETLINRHGDTRDVMLIFDKTTSALGFIRFLARGQFTYAIIDVLLIIFSALNAYKLFFKFNMLTALTLIFTLMVLIAFRVAVNQRSSREYYNKLLIAGWTHYNPNANRKFQPIDNLSSPNASFQMNKEEQRNSQVYREAVEQERSIDNDINQDLFK